MKIKKPQKLGIIIFILMVSLSYFLFFNEKIEVFYFLVSLSFIIGGLPFVLLIISGGSKEEENNQMFLEFSRDLVESAKSGTPISKGIINLKNKDYGSLSPNIEKLANQIEIGVSVRKAFEVFSGDLDNNVINRAVMLISESEKAGGNIEEILESVSKSVQEIEKLKKERKASVYNLVIEGYIIFFVFIAIILIMEFSIMSMVSGISTEYSLESMGVPDYNAKPSPQVGDLEVSSILLLILLIQGAFTGLIVGKLAEGNLKSGIKHSFIMLASALVIYLGAKMLLG